MLDANDIPRVYAIRLYDDDANLCAERSVYLNDHEATALHEQISREWAGTVEVRAL